MPPSRPPRLPPSHSAPRIKLSPVKKSKRDSKLPSTPRSKKPVGVGGININTSSSESCPSAKPASPHINSAASKKLNKINAILSQPEIDLWALRELCLTEGGLINDDIRRKAWPKLVGITLAKQTPEIDAKSQLGTIGGSLSVISPESVSTFKNTIMASCIDAAQISLDTARCTWHLLNGSQRVNRNTMKNKSKKRVRTLLKRKQHRLGNFINLTLIRTYDEHIKLRYYQGYHDISCIILSVLGGETTVPSSRMENIPRTIQAKATKTAQAMGLDLPSEVLAKLSQSHLKDMMKENFEYLIKALRLVLFPLIQSLDPELHQHLVDCDMEPFFCLSWIITWFSHDVRDTTVVKRLFDLFIASHPLMPIYLSVAMICHPMNRMEVLGADPDFASVHKALAQLPMNSCSVGWKFIGSPMGGEYVSGEEDDDSCSFDGSILSQDVYRDEGGGGFDDDDDSLAPSLGESTMLSGGWDNSRVPFQDLIDLGITFMRRMPPRTLIRLAHRYYDSETIQQLASDVDEINLLRQPPDWAVASSIESDYVAKKRLKAAKAELKEENVKSDKANSKKKEHSRKVKYPHAVVAAGIGPDGDGDARRRRKRRKLLRTGAISVGILSVLLGISSRNVFYRFPSSGRVAQVDATAFISVVHRSDKLQPKIEIKRLFKTIQNVVVDVIVVEPPMREEEFISVDTTALSKSLQDMPNKLELREKPNFDKVVPEESSKKASIPSNAQGSSTVVTKKEIVSKNIRKVNRIHDEVEESTAISSITKKMDPIEAFSPMRLFTAFIKHHKRIAMQFYMEIRDVVSNLDTKELRDSMGREVSLIVETRKDALANLDTKELRESLKREVILMVETTKKALANEAEIIFM